MHNSGLNGLVTVPEIQAPSPTPYRRLDSLGRHCPKLQPGFSLAAKTIAWVWLIDEMAYGNCTQDLIVSNRLRLTPLNRNRKKQNKESKRTVISAGIDRLCDLDRRRFFRQWQPAIRNLPQRHGYFPETAVMDTP